MLRLTLDARNKTESSFLMRARLYIGDIPITRYDTFCLIFSIIRINCIEDD